MDREYMIRFIREHQYYPAGELEAMPDDKIKEIYERLLDWIG